MLGGVSLTHLRVLEARLYSTHTSRCQVAIGGSYRRREPRRLVINREQLGLVGNNGEYLGTAGNSWEPLGTARNR